MLLRPRLTIAFLLTSVIPIFIIGIITYSYVKSSMEQSVFDGIKTIAQSKEVSLFLYLDKLKTTTTNFSSDGLIRESLEKLNSDATQHKVIASLEQHLSQNKQPLNKDILFIDVVNLDGIIVASSQTGRSGLSYGHENYFSKAQKRVYLSDVHEDGDGVIKMDIAAPLYSRKQPTKLIGVLVNHFSIHSLKKLFDGNIPLNGKTRAHPRGMGVTGETYLVNEERLMINDSLFFEQASFKLKVNTYPVTMHLQENKEVVGIWKDYRGVNVVGASILISFDDFRWTLISEQDTEEAFSSVEKLKHTFVVIVLILSIFVIFISIEISKRITDPIGVLTRELEELGDGKVSKHIKNIKSQDEIGFLARTFERMSIRLNKALEDVQKKNKKLEEISNHDGLTGLYNHRCIKEHMEVEFNRAYRYKTPLTCILLDIDFFKSINDTYGHLFGDVVLQGIAGVINNSCRKTDLAGRYGGEEFVILLPHTDLDQARVVAQKLFNAIIESNYCDNENCISVTVSIGISFYHAGLETYAEMLSEADQAMYTAKKSGRNQICVCGKETQTYI